MTTFDRTGTLPLPNSVVPEGVIDLDDALEGLERAVAENGENFVYVRPRMGAISQPCQYMQRDEDGVPTAGDCIVGKVLFAHGVRLAVEDDSNVLGVTVGPGLVKRGLLISASATEVLEAAQHAQDRGATWGTALKIAKATARDIRDAEPTA